ncbi:MAG: TetR/AcrR family transcriptional regulator [Fimbriimonas sp.]|nr:TetR/AcrR family transcriptional regulator [Fimbriimonas sp.]
MGRHRQFDRDEVLDLATRVFTEKGFEATSIQELIDAMGINRASLYDTFGDKEALFLEVLDRYDEMLFVELETCLAEYESKIDGLREWFYRVVEQGANRLHPGCLMVNSTIERALRDEHCAARAAKNFRRSEETYYEALVEAQRGGQISPDRDLRALARFIAGTIRGLRVAAKATSDYQTLKDIADIALSNIR